MKHFTRITEMNTQAATAVLARMAHLWQAETWRQKLRLSPHGETRSIILRGPPSTKPRDVLHSLDVIDRPGYGNPEFRTLVEGIASYVGGEPARALIAELPPEARVMQHTDTGTYAENTERFHLALQTNPLAILYCNGETCNVREGEVMWLDKHLPHSAINMGVTSRVHLIVDVWAC